MRIKLKKIIIYVFITIVIDIRIVRNANICMWVNLNAHIKAHISLLTKKIKIVLVQNLVHFLNLLNTLLLLKI